MCLIRPHGTMPAEKPIQAQEGFVDYRRKEYLRQQGLGEQYRNDANEYLSRFCSESILGATVLLGFIFQWIIADNQPVQSGCLLRVMSISAWLLILSSIVSGMTYLCVSIRFYRYYGKLYEQYCDKIERSVSRDEIRERYQDVFGKAPRSSGDGLLVVQGILFAAGTVALSIALFLK